MAITIRKNENQKGTTYTVTVRVPGHKSQTKTYKRKADADSWGKSTELEIKRKEFIDPKDLQLSLGDALKKYLTEVSIKKAATTHGREKKAATQLKRGIGEGTFLPNISGAVLARYRDDRMKTVSAYPVRIEFALLSHMFQTARKEWGYTRLKNPVDEIFRPKPPRGRIVMLTDDQCRLLLDECKTADSPLLYYYILLLMHSGMRPGEAAQLEWPQMNIEARIITLTDTKNGTQRSVPMTMTAADAFRALKARGKGSGPVFSSRPMAYLQKTINNGTSIFRKDWEAARTRAGMPKLHMHDLRHTAASHMIRAGVDVRVLSEVFGWLTIQMAMRYGHVLTDQALAAIDKIDNLGQGSPDAGFMQGDGI